MANGYMILPVDWKYNDEGYDKSGFDKPKEIFTDKEKAKAEWLKREISSYRTNAIFVYGDLESNLKMGVTPKQLEKFIHETFDPEFDFEYPYEFSIDKTASDEDIIKLFKFVDIKFNVLEKIPIK